MIYRVMHRGRELTEFLDETHAYQFAGAYNKLWTGTTWHGAEAWVIPPTGWYMASSEPAACLERI